MAQAQSPQIVGEKLTRRQWVVLIMGAITVVALSANAVLSDATPMLVVPVALAVILIALLDPFIVYVMMLLMLSIVPIESRFFDFYIPNWLQAVVPALLIGTILYNIVHPGRKAFSANWADVPVLGFLAIGYLGVFLEPGAVSYKFFTNQQVFPVLMYFVAKWLPIDRQRFRSQLRLQLLAVGVLAAIMISQVLSGYGPVYHGFSYLGRGDLGRGPMWSISDTAAYTSIWPIFFLYALATGLPGIGRRPRLFWSVALILSVGAALSTTERTAPAAIFAAFALVLLHRQMAKYVVTAGLIGLLLAPVWLATPGGRRATDRMHTLKHEGAGFERIIYRDKALAYTRSPSWNPAWGTGFGRIDEVARQTIPADDWVYDYNWAEFRLRTDFATRPTHCAPLTLYAEYGWGGMLMLSLTAIMIGAGLVRTRRFARQTGGHLDVALLLTAVGAFAGVMINGIFHNTEGVVEVLVLVWSFGGMVIGHPEVFVMNSIPAPQRPQ